MNIQGPPAIAQLDEDQSSSRHQRRKVTPRILSGVCRIVDLIMIFLAFVAAKALIDHESTYFDEFDFYSLIFILCSYSALASVAQLFSLRSIVKPLKCADDVIIAILASFCLLMSTIFGLSAEERFSMSGIFQTSGLTIIFVLIGRRLLWKAVFELSRRKVLEERVALFGAGEQTRRFLERYERSDTLFSTVVGVFTDGDPADAPASIGGKSVLGGVEDLNRWARDARIDSIVVTLPWSDDQRVIESITTIRELPINVYLSTDLVGFQLKFRPVIDGSLHMPMFEVTLRPISGWSQLFKALEDYVIASVLLLLLSPLLLLIALAIKLDSKGPVLFRQKRLGFNNRIFHIYKFRSMEHRSDEENVVRQATKADRRVTRVGRIIRATSLDELPQLFNVLDGTMSLVGPRPHALSHNEEYGQQIRGYFSRHRVKPGITGWAQVNGLRGETEALEKMEARVAHDIYYADNWSLLFDLKILTMTGLVFLFQKSAY